MKKNMIFLAVSLISSQVFAVQEIPDRNINDLAIASIENNEAVIRYNPESCKALGDQVCDFFISREHGHIVLGHTLGGEYTVEEDLAADCWVTQNAPENLSKAAYIHFTNEGDMGSWNHGSGGQRAKNLMECPEELPIYEKPLGSDNESDQKQTRSRYNHYIADAAFKNVERRYPRLFPKFFWGSQFGKEYRHNNGLIEYVKKYRNGSGLSEYKGRLWYRIPRLGSYFYNWRDAGSISKWAY